MATPTRSARVGLSHVPRFLLFRICEEINTWSEAFVDHSFICSLFSYFSFLFFYLVRGEGSWKRSYVTIEDARKSSRRRYLNLWPVRVAALARVELKWYSIGSREFIALRYVCDASVHRSKFYQWEKMKYPTGAIIFFWKIAISLDRINYYRD